MISMAIHMRISGVTVSDEDVKSRSAAATSLASSWRKEKNVSNIVDKVANIANSLGRDCNPPPLLGSEVQGAIQKKSPSFLFDERPLEVSICAGVAMISILSGSPSNIGWTNADVYAAALWSSLAYQPVLEAERLDGAAPAQAARGGHHHLTPVGEPVVQPRHGAQRLEPVGRAAGGGGGFRRRRRPVPVDHARSGPVAGAEGAGGRS